MRSARDTARALRRLAKLLVTLFGTSPRQARRLVALAAQLLRVIDLAQGALGGLAARCRQRIDTGRHARA